MYRNNQYYALNRDRIVQLRLNEVINKSSSFKIGTTTLRVLKKNNIDEPERFAHITELCTFRSKVMAQYIESVLVDACIVAQYESFVNTQNSLSGINLPDESREYKVYVVWTAK